MMVQVILCKIVCHDQVLDTRNNQKSVFLPYFFLYFKIAQDSCKIMCQINKIIEIL